MESAPMIRAGKLSYFIYLFHLPLAWTIYAVGFGMEPNLQSAKALAVMGACLLAIYGLGELSFRFIEGPLIRRSHAFFSGENG
jgi:peptidoglycan/LPS O-acetylase OafA/YrhL